MTEDLKEARRRARLIQRLDKMVASGRVTEEEAARVRAAGNPEEVNAAMGGIRVRHATPRIAAAVANGKMTQAEADTALAQLRAGEPPRSLRAHLGGLRSRH
jgi:hypothetical protein